MKINLGRLKQIIKEAAMLVDPVVMDALKEWVRANPDADLEIVAPYQGDDGVQYPAAVVHAPGTDMQMDAAYVDEDGTLMVNTPNGFEPIAPDQLMSVDPLA